MAQIVGYWQDNVTYTEGPFVLCGSPHPGSVSRIECEAKGHHCPVMVQFSIYQMLDAKRPGWRKDKCAAVDWLNEQVREGAIILRDRTWHAPEFEEKV